MATFDGSDLTAPLLQEEDHLSDLRPEDRALADQEPDNHMLSDLPRLAAGVCPTPLKRYIYNNRI